MDRQTAIGLISRQYDAVASELNLPEGLLSVVDGAADMALRALGVGESDLATATVPDSKTVDLIRLLDYYTLEALLRHVPTFADVQAYQPALAKKRSQIFAQLRLLRDDAAQLVVALGYTAVSSMGAPLWQADRVTLDFLEPNPDQGW